MIVVDGTTIANSIFAETEYEYDELGQTTKITYPDGNDVDFEYDEAGRLVKRTDQRGIVTTYAYDQAGYRTQTIYPDSTVTINITPDWQGRIDTLKVDAAARARYSYIGSRGKKDEKGS